MTIHAIVSIVALLWYVGLLCLAVRRTESKESSPFTFGLYLTAMIVSQVGYLLVSIARDEHSAAVAYCAMIPLGNAVSPFFWLFVRSVVRPPPGRLLTAATILATLAAGAAFFSLRESLFVSFHLEPRAGIFVPVFGDAVPFVTIYTSLFLCLAVFELASGIRRAKDAASRRFLRLLLLGLSAYLLGLLANAVPALRAYPIDVLCNVVNAGLVALAMSERRLLNVPVAAKRGVVRVLPMLIAATAFFLVFSAVAWLVGGLEIRAVLALSLLAASTSAFATGPFQAHLRARLEASLFSREKLLGEMVQRVSIRANSELELEALAALILDDIFETMRVARVGLFLRDEESGSLALLAEKHGDRAARGYGDEEGIVRALEPFLEGEEGRASPSAPPAAGEARLSRSLIVRVVARSRAVGVLVAEPAESARAFSALESLTLRTLANQTAAAVHNARLHRDLRRELEKRTALQEQMVRMQKMEALGSLAAGVAHDMNNVLAAVMGVASAALEERHGAKVASSADLEQIVAACHRGRELSDALLGFAKQRSAARARLDLREVIGDVALILARTIPKDIRIDKRVDALCPPVEASRSQIHRALVNLSINAVAAMGARGRLGFDLEAVRLEAARTVGDIELAPGCYARLSVSDTGVGMEPETLRRAFDPFFTTRLNEGGTGLGLSLVYGIVSSHGGAVDIESARGEGTRVSVWLPAMTTQQTEVASDAPSPRSAEVAPLHVLIVDDEPMVLRATARVLQALGHTCETAVNGRDGIERFRESVRGFDVVILDMVMPVMDGAEAFCALRELDPEIPVVLCSGYSDGERGRELLEREKVSLLPKPFDSAALLASLGELGFSRGRASL